MADPGTDQVTVAVVLFVVGIVALIFFETRFLRKKMKNRRVREATRDTELPDEAHNAIVTTKAIVSTLERQGIRSDEATAWIREADMAFNRKNYRVAMDLTGKAKERLLALKAVQASKGDLAKLELMSVPGPAEEMTTKALLQKEVPPNLLQSKFSIELAGTAIERGRVAGRDVTQASELLETARTRFESRDYTAALLLSRQSKRAAEGDLVSVTIHAIATEPRSVVARGSAPEVERACPSCRSPLQADDAFCRKCGTRIAPSECVSCGASLLADDAFCRKCGSPVSR